MKRRRRKSNKTLALAKKVYKHLRQSHIEKTLVCTSDIKLFKTTFEKQLGKKIKVSKASRIWKTYWVELKKEQPIQDSMVERARKFLPDVNTYAYSEYHVMIQNTLKGSTEMAELGHDVFYIELMFRKEKTSENKLFWAYIGRR